MRNSHPQPIDKLFGKIFQPNHGYASFQRIQQHALTLLKLNREVSSLLPGSLRPWCRVANVRKSIILMETASASWLMRLRYEQHQLLSTLRMRILPSLSAINIRINPTMVVITRKRKVNR